MISVPDEIIEEIADQLDCGMKCYLKISSCTIVTTIKDEYCRDSGIDELDEELDQIKENPSDYIEFQELESRESYNMMVDFASEITDTEFQARLMKSLDQESPFRKFKSTLDSSDDYRQMWFDYKKNRYIKFVKTQIENDLNQ